MAIQRLARGSVWLASHSSRARTGYGGSTSRIRIAGIPVQNGLMKHRSIVLIALVVVLTACSGGASETTATVASLETQESSVPSNGVTTTTPIDMEAAAMAAVECFREQGVDLPDPVVDAGGNVQFSQDFDPSTLDQDAMAAAQEQCSEELSRVITGFIGTDLTSLQDGLLEYAQCMRDNGFDMPDPDFAGFAEGGLAAGPFGDIDQTDPDFVTANDVCEDILATLTPGG